MNQTSPKDYLSKNKLFNNSPVFSYSGPFDVKLMDLSYNFTQELVRSVKEFCKQNGFVIDKITFASIYEADIDPNLESRIEANSTSNLFVLKTKDGRYEAILETTESILVT